MDMCTMPAHIPTFIRIHIISMCIHTLTQGALASIFAIPGLNNHSSTARRSRVVHDVHSDDESEIVTWTCDSSEAVTWTCWSLMTKSKCCTFAVVLCACRVGAAAVIRLTSQFWMWAWMNRKCIYEALCLYYSCFVLQIIFIFMSNIVYQILSQLGTLPAPLRLCHWCCLPRDMIFHWHKFPLLQVCWQVSPSIANMHWLYGLLN
jgi:hypothetical protein